jgi:hypothetical protein
MKRVLAAIAGTLVLVVAAEPAQAHTLSYGKARAAVQQRANAFAHQATTVNVMFRQSRHRYYAQARWQYVEQVPCAGCGFDPATGTAYDTTFPATRFCSVELSVGYSSGSHSSRNRRIVARVTGHLCF